MTEAERSYSGAHLWAFSFPRKCHQFLLRYPLRARASPARSAVGPAFEPQRLQSVDPSKSSSPAHGAYRCDRESFLPCVLAGEALMNIPRPPAGPSVQSTTNCKTSRVLKGSPLHAEGCAAVTWVDFLGPEAGAASSSAFAGPFLQAVRPRGMSAKPAHGSTQRKKLSGARKSAFRENPPK